MAKQLIEEDRVAVDLLLDHGQESSEGVPEILPAGGDGLPHRRQSVERILSLLQLIPHGDPPADLAGNTMLRIDAALAQMRPPATDGAAETRPSI